MLSFLTTIKNEFLSYFVPEKMEYKITGECIKCGKCCRYMYSFDTYTTTDFKIMQFLFPAYRRFYIRGKDEEGNLIPLTLQPNESLVLTVFLNPGAKQIEDLKVSISETGGVGLGKNMTGLKLQPHIKTVIEKLMLPAQGITVENSKWVELMPDETSLKALSIPGTGNSFSMNL